MFSNNKRDSISSSPLLSESDDQGDLILFDDHETTVFCFDPILEPARRLSSFPSINFNSPQVKLAPVERRKTLHSLPYPIKLQIGFSFYSEIQQMAKLVEKIRHERQTNDGQNTSDGLFYCQRVQRIVSQHVIEQQMRVTIHIFIETNSKPIKFTDISLQSSIAHILYQLNEVYPFDSQNHILKLRTTEEYLRDDDVLCDLEYIINRLTSLKPIEFILVKRPRRSVSSQSRYDENETFEKFFLQKRNTFFEAHQSLFRHSKTNDTARSSDKTNLANFTARIVSFLTSDSEWIDEFRIKLEYLIIQLEERFNSLANPNVQKFETNYYFSQIHNFLNSIKNIQETCLSLKSSSLYEKKRPLEEFLDQFLTKSSANYQATLSSDNLDYLLSLVCQLTTTVVNVVNTFCDARLIPYKISISSGETKIVDVETFSEASNIKSIQRKSITNEIEPLRIVITSLCSIPLDVRRFLIRVRICYGNRSYLTRTIGSFYVDRSNYISDRLADVHLNQQITFDEISVCALQRESLILFELFVSLSDDNDSGMNANSPKQNQSSPMRLIGWCSQSIFDQEQIMITGEKCFTLLESCQANPNGFYSLRNIFQRDCPQLYVTFLNQPVAFQEVSPRKDIPNYCFTQIQHDRQEKILPLLERTNHIRRDYRKIISNDEADDVREFNDEECDLIWSFRYYLTHKPHAMGKLLMSRLIWDYPSLFDIYGLINQTLKTRSIDEAEAFELLLPSLPDRYVRSVAYQSLINNLNGNDLNLYLPQLLEMIKFDFDDVSTIVEHFLRESVRNFRFAHQLYWQLRETLLRERVHYLRYYHLFLGLIYVLPTDFRSELELETNLCFELRNLSTEIKKQTRNCRETVLVEQLNKINRNLFDDQSKVCRLPCQFHFMTNGIDVALCSIFKSYTTPLKLIFKSSDSMSEDFSTVFKLGDDLRQDQIVLQLFSCMDKIWRSNDLDLRLTLFNVVQTSDCCGFIEMINDSETLLQIESKLGPIRGTFGESALYGWLRLNNESDRDFQIAVQNLTYSCAAYCVATYVLGIGDRHNENILIKRSGHLFHIDFGKYLGDTQKFAHFNRDRAPFVFTKQMLYAMSEGGTSKDAMHRFVDLCSQAFETLRQSSLSILILLSHLCSSNIPNLTTDAIRFVYDRLSPTLNYAQSVTRFTDLIVDSLNSTWTVLNGFIHKVAVNGISSSANNSSTSNPSLNIFLNKVVRPTNEKILSIRLVQCEKRLHPQKYYLYRFQIRRNQRTTFHYRTYAEFFDFYERLKIEFPLIGLNLKYSRRIEDKVLAQRRSSDINAFLNHLFELANEIFQSDLVWTFFQTIQRDEQADEIRPNSSGDSSASEDSLLGTQPIIRIHLNYDQGKLFVMIPYAKNLPSFNNNEPKAYCKCYLFPDQDKTTKQKGKTINSKNPIFNDVFSYEMSLADIQKRILRVSIWNSQLTSANFQIGQVEIVLSDIDWSKESDTNYTFSTN